MDLEQPTDYFVHPIYWDSEVIYRRKYICSILTSVIGKEQRSVLNTIVRRELQYTTLTRTQSESYYLKGHLRLNMHQVWGVPLWMYEMTLTQNASGTTLNVDSTENIEISEGQEVVIVSDYKTYEVGTIDTGGIATTTITLDSSLSSTWNSGLKVYPIMRSKISGMNDLKFPYKHLIMVEMTFTESFRGGSY